MIQKNTTKKLLKQQFEPLQQSSPQIKPYSPIDKQIQELNLDQGNSSKERSPGRGLRKHKAKFRQTNLIKIRPILKQFDNQQQKDQNLNGRIQSLGELEKHNTPAFTNNQKNSQMQNSAQDSQPYQSPVLYKIDDQQQNQQNYSPHQQIIPQSSRRQLKSSNKEDIKSDDSDSLQSPKKLLNKKGKIISLNSNSSKNNQINKISTPQKQKRRRRPKNIKFEVQQIKQEPRQTSQVYNYEQKQQKFVQYNNQQEKDEAEDQNQQQIEQQSQDQNQQEQQEQKQQQFVRPSQEKNRKKTQNQKNQEISHLKNKKTQAVFKSSSFYTLINAQIPKSNFINLIIKRKRSDDGFYQKLVVFQCFLLEDKKHIMTCIKDRYFKTTSHFEFYRQRNNLLKFNKQNLYGYLDSNFTGTEFVFKSIQNKNSISQKSTAIDKYQSMKMAQSMQAISQKNYKPNKMFPTQQVNQNSISKDTPFAKQTCYINFKPNFFGLIGQRQVKVLKKKNKKLNQTQNFSALRSAQQNGQVDKYYSIQTKKAKTGSKGLQLDFKGTAKIQSTKNIVLQGQNSQDVLYFGKLKQDIYSLSIGNPFSILQGLAFGIANLDRKFFVN